MDTSLRSFLASYFAQRDLRPTTRIFFRCKLAAFEQWLQRRGTLADLTATTINAFLDDRLSNRSRETARGERAVLRALWQAAYDERLVAEPPLRLKRIRRDLREVEAWDCEQIEKLLAVAAAQNGCFRCSGVHRGAFWIAAVRVLFDTGIRAGDLLALRADKLTGPGSFVVRQQKTGKDVAVAISAATWQAVEAIRSPIARPRLFGDAISRRSFFEAFSALCKAAGLDGRTKMLRRASGSVVEAEFPGQGHEHLGNGRGVFERHYLARRLAPLAARIPSWRPSAN